MSTEADRRKALDKWLVDLDPPLAKIFKKEFEKDEKLNSAKRDEQEKLLLEGAKAQEQARLMNAPFLIHESVGTGGANKPTDVMAVQIALNLIAHAKTKLGIDGDAGTGTIAAIKNYQKSLGQTKQTGLVKPGDPTALALAGKPATAAPAPTKAPVTPAAPQMTTLTRLYDVAQHIKGPNSERIRRVMEIARAAGPRWTDLWHYNYYVQGKFLGTNTGGKISQKDQQEMTKTTGSKPPFNGDSGQGLWRVYPFREKLNGYCPNGACTDEALGKFLVSLDGNLADVVDEVHQVAHGAEATNDLMYDYYKSIESLAQDKSHLYSAGY
jgi:peptidoglycan hydrolase-like protein with peptidoglycan-binding domain